MSKSKSSNATRGKEAKKHHRNSVAPAETKTAVEPRALYKVNAAAPKRSTIAERLEESEALTCKMLGLEDPDLAQALIKQVKQLEAAMAFGGGAEVSGIAMPMLFEMKPTNLTQALLAVQMSGVHHAALLYMKRAALIAKANLNSKTPDTNMMMVMRLMGLFNEQLEAMAKLKGKTRQQKVIVEHVHVHHGGQAIVGTGTAAGRTGGAKQEGGSGTNRNKTP
jgi:hypothetical protein